METRPIERRLPLVVKLAFTAFLAVLVPYYWSAYGPTNFLYFCDLALFFTLAALWTERPLWASMPAVGIVLPQLLWVADFLAHLVGGKVTGMTDYMFNPGIPLFVRGLSSFHGWLPLVVLWLVWQLGYDRRALAAWTVLAWLLLVVCYTLLPPGPAPESNPNLPVNVNYVYGPSDEHPQTWMPPLAWLATLLVGLPLVFFLPTHLLLVWLFPPARPAARPGRE